MHTLNEIQQVAASAVEAAVNQKEYLAGVFGGPGVGKSYTIGKIIDHLVNGMEKRVILCAPTNKALKVSIECIPDHLDHLRPSPVYLAKYWQQKDVLVGTIAQLLGYIPDYLDDNDRVSFSKEGQSIMSAVKNSPEVLIIDEISMVPHKVLLELYSMARIDNFTIVVVGDADQLPPVKAGRIELSRIPNSTTLISPVRNTNEEYLSMLNEMKVEGVRAIKEIEGSSIKVEDAEESFLNSLSFSDHKIVDDYSASLSVFIAYTNKVVNRVQELACQKLYGHDSKSLEEGERVICTSKMANGKINNFDFIEITYMSSYEDEIMGKRVTIKSDRGIEHECYYNRFADNPKSPYKLALQKLKEKAKALQREKAEKEKDKKHLSHDAEEARKDAWKEYFNMENAILKFVHPFAMTSHKSQGSTFKNVYMPRGDFLDYDVSAAYVAASRHTDKLFYE